MFIKKSSVIYKVLNRIYKEDIQCSKKKMEISEQLGQRAQLNLSQFVYVWVNENNWTKNCTSNWGPIWSICCEQ